MNQPRDAKAKAFELFEGSKINNIKIKFFITDKFFNIYHKLL